jgi:hypothetical protein
VIVSAPKARTHTSLGQRPRKSAKNTKRAESPRQPTNHARFIFISAIHFQSNAMPNGWIAPLPLMAFGVADFLGRCPRLVWHRAFGPEIAADGSD